MEGQRQAVVWPGDIAEVPVIEVIAHAVAASAQSAQRHGPAELMRVKSVVEATVLLDHVRLGLIEADVVQLAAIDALRQTTLIVQRDPFAPERLARARQQKGVLRLGVAWAGEFW